MAYRPSYRRRIRSTRRPRGYSMRGSGRTRSRTRRSNQRITLVIQTPSDALPRRPVAGQFARNKRRARF